MASAVDPNLVEMLRSLLSAGGSVPTMSQRLKGLHLPAPLIMARSDGRAVSVVTKTPKLLGYYQRTTFRRALGPSADDDLHATIELAVVRAWDLGYTILADSTLLCQYMPTERP